MSQSDFDKYFLTLPPFDKTDDFYTFWNSSISTLKKTPIDAVARLNNRKTSNKFKVYNISYQGFMKTRVTGELLLPNEVDNPRVIIHIHDYNKKINVNHQMLDDTVAHYFAILRGHNDLKFEVEKEETITPGYMIENIMDIEKYYVKSVFLDIYKSIDMLRLNKKLDCSKVGIMGKGFGAAAAVFATTFSKRVGAVVLDTPSFCYLPLSQNISKNDAANEINSFIASYKSQKKTIKNNLTYFDVLNFADKIKCPVLTTVGFKDTYSPPKCIFSLFNHFLCEKSIEIYPDEGNEAGGKKQFKKSLEWIVNLLYSE